MIELRIKMLKEYLVTKNIDVMLVSDPYNILYLTNFNGFSLDERDAFLLITKDESFIFTDGRYIEDGGLSRRHLPERQLQVQGLRQGNGSGELGIFQECATRHHLRDP